LIVKLQKFQPKDKGNGRVSILVHWCAKKDPPLPLGVEIMALAGINQYYSVLLEVSCGFV